VAFAVELSSILFVTTTSPNVQHYYNSTTKILTDARLLVTGRDEATKRETVEVAHEALIRSWERLQTWLGKDREFLLWLLRLQIEKTEWQHSRYDEGILLRGALLAEAER